MRMEEPSEQRRRARKLKDLTLRELAAEIGVSVPQMSRIEQGGTSNARHAVALAGRLELPVEAMIAPAPGERAA